MIVPTITMLPAYADLDVWAGDTVAFAVGVTIAGDAADLTTGELTAQLDDGTEFDIEVDGNVATLTIAEGTTKAQPDPYSWDLQWSDSPQGRITLVAGRMRVREEVTP